MHRIKDHIDLDPTGLHITVWLQTPCKMPLAEIGKCVGLPVPADCEAAMLAAFDGAAVRLLRCRPVGSLASIP